MPNIKPISDLRNHSEVLHDLAAGAPVFLPKNRGGKYAIIDIQDYEKSQTTLRLMNKLAKGRKSGETEGWLSSEEMREFFRKKQMKHKIYYSMESRRTQTKSGNISPLSFKMLPPQCGLLLIS